MMIKKICAVALFCFLSSLLIAQSSLNVAIDSVFNCISDNISRDYLNICIKDKTNLTIQILDDFDSDWYDQCRKNTEILLNSRSNHEAMEKATLLALLDKSFQDSLVHLFKYYFADFEPEELSAETFRRYEKLLYSLTETVCYIPSSSIALEFSYLLKLHRDSPYPGYDVADPNLAYLSCIVQKLTKYGLYEIYEMLDDNHRDNEAWDEVILRLQTDSTLWRQGIWDGAEYKMD